MMTTRTSVIKLQGQLRYLVSEIDRVERKIEAAPKPATLRRLQARRDLLRERITQTQIQIMAAFS
jgi:hypothetical protein